MECLIMLAYQFRRRLSLVIFSVFLAVTGHSYANGIITPDTVSSEIKKSDAEKNISAALSANAQIQFQMGLLYEEGIGFSQNYIFARYWFEKSAEQNNEDALFYLGSYYMHGSGIEKNKEKGLLLYKKASELGSSRATNNLALQEEKEGRIEEAILLYKKAIDLGSNAAILNLGEIYKDIGEYDKAERILTQGLYKEDVIKSEALRKLGYLYSDVDFPRNDRRKSKKYYLESVSLGDKWALNDLGMLYFHDKNYKEAFNYIKMAADENIPGGINNLGALYQHGYGVKQDYAQAISLYEKSAKMGSPGGYFNLGGMYEHGDGVTQDDTKALEYYEQALAAGHYPAQKKIDLLKAKQRK